MSIWRNEEFHEWKRKHKSNGRGELKRKDEEMEESIVWEWGVTIGESVFVPDPVPEITLFLGSSCHSKSNLHNTSFLDNLSLDPRSIDPNPTVLQSILWHPLWFGKRKVAPSASSLERRASFVSGDSRWCTSLAALRYSMAIGMGIWNTPSTPFSASSGLWLWA